MPGQEYTTPGLPPPPAVSKTTLVVNPLLLDVYGLEELPSPTTPVVVLWLLHPRGRTRARMHDIAARVVHAFHAADRPSDHGLIAVAFDMPNHGTRNISDLANESWDAGNVTHAVDMFSMVRTAARDLSAMMDVLALYLRRDVAGHLALGWSLGAHAVWQAYMLEPRLRVVVAVVGCPDYGALMRGRAEKSGVDWEEAFPEGLRALCQAADPMCLLKRWEASEDGAENSGRLKGKKLLLCSGAEDALVPHACGQEVVDKLRRLDVPLDDRVYGGVGHKFSKDMVCDAVEFLVGAANERRQLSRE